MTTDEASTDKSSKEGFASPSENVTEPCLTYMARIMELRDFIWFYFNFVKTSKSLSAMIPETTKAQVGPKEIGVLEYNYSSQRPFINQIMLSRATESFDLYLTTILRDIFLKRPEMLKSAGAIDVATVIDTGNYDDLIWQIVERKVHELSYKPLKELRKFIRTRTGIELFPSQETFEKALIASEIRNLIAHNDCIVSDLFRSRTNGIDLPLEVSSTGRIILEDEWLRRTSYTLDSLVFSFDQNAIKKFGLQSHFRQASFILRS